MKMTLSLYCNYIKLKGENTKFVRLLTIVNSPLLRFAEHSFVEVNFFQHGAK